MTTAGKVMFSVDLHDCYGDVHERGICQENSEHGRRAPGKRRAEAVVKQPAKCYQLKLRFYPRWWGWSAAYQWGELVIHVGPLVVNAEVER